MRGSGQEEVGMGEEVGVVERESVVEWINLEEILVLLHTYLIPLFLPLHVKHLFSVLKPYYFNTQPFPRETWKKATIILERPFIYYTSLRCKNMYVL